MEEVMLRQLVGQGLPSMLGLQERTMRHTLRALDMQEQSQH